MPEKLTRGAVRQVAAVRQAHAEDRVAGLEHAEVDRHVRRRAGMGLHVHVLGAEELLRALDGQRLHRVGELAAAVVAPVGIALGVLVREDRTLRLEHRLAHVVLGGDQDDLLQFALLLALDGVVDIDVCMLSVLTCCCPSYKKSLTTDKHR